MNEKISLKDLENAISKNPIPIGEVNGQKIMFSPNIPYQKVTFICKKIADNVFKPNGVYFPALKDILLFCFIAQNMTNLPLKQDKDGNIDIDFVYQLMTSEICKKLKNQLKYDMTYQFLNREVKELINYKKEIYFRTIGSRKGTLKNLDSLIFELRGMAKKFSSFADEHKNLIENGKIDKIIETLDKAKNK